MYPPLPDGSQPPMRLTDIDEGYGLAPGALSKAGLATVADVAALTEVEVLALPGVGPKTLINTARLLADHGLALVESDLEGAA
jgi:hypothetical protein